MVFFDFRILRKDNYTRGEKDTHLISSDHQSRGPFHGSVGAPRFSAACFEFGAFVLQLCLDAACAACYWLALHKMED